MEEIQRLWEEFQNIEFPRGHFTSEDGLIELPIDLAEHDTFASGCIDTFIHNKGCLDQHRIKTLEICIHKLEVMKNAFGEENAAEKAYVTQLLTLSKMVLEAMPQFYN